ncbi:MAG: hypothetical protein Q7J25_06750 [Vicinamibacterales bacterium]|nr:hypothetical protein [Vicinamibacterales bacterium]
MSAIAVANGGTGTLQLVDAETYEIRGTVRVGGDADNVRYDRTAKRLYVAYQGGLAVVDPTSSRVVQRVSIEGHPESFQLEHGGSRIFVNLPDAAQVVVADRKTASVVARWPALTARLRTASSVRTGLFGIRQRLHYTYSSRTALDRL